MPRTRSLAWSELRIGVVTIAALVIAALTIFMLTGDTGFSWQRYNLKTRFGSVPGLKSGSPVRLAGVEVGAVEEVLLAGEEVEVTFSVNDDYQPQITSNSVARLGSISLLGEAAVDITPSGSGTPIPEWGYVPTGRAAAQIADITDQASQGIAELTSLLTDVRNGRGTVGKLMTDDQLYVELRQFVATAGDLTEGIRAGRGSIGQLMNDPKMANALEASLANIETMTRQINAGEGSLGRLLKDDTFSRSLTSATSNIDTLVARLNKGDGTAGRLINDPALYNRMNSLTERIDLLLTRLNDGEGTAGLLLKDRQLYENMNKVTTDLSALIAAITKNPKDYLNVRISVFGFD
jgi:phospholipid/cholesterol/gamma-HCH transport system substrate-binding protein